MFAARDRPGWDEDVAALCAVVAALPPARTLDVACGTGFLTRELRGEVTGLDASESMVAIARARMPGARFVVGDALALPFADGSFDRVFTGHFYDHLQPGERARFLAEARRVAGELVVADSALREGVEPVQWQERVLNDGSRHEIYKRYFTGARAGRGARRGRGADGRGVVRGRARPRLASERQRRLGRSGFDRRGSGFRGGVIT